MSEATEVELIPLLRQYADVADAGGKPHWATAMRRAVGDLAAAREQIAELDATVRTLATVQTQLIAERDAALERVVEIDVENGVLKAKLSQSRARVDALVDALRCVLEDLEVRAAARKQLGINKEVSLPTSDGVLELAHAVLALLQEPQP